MPIAPSTREPQAPPRAPHPAHLAHHFESLRQQYVAAEVSQELFDQVNIQQYVNDALPKRAVDKFSFTLLQKEIATGQGSGGARASLLPAAARAASRDAAAEQSAPQFE